MTYPCYNFPWKIVKEFREKTFYDRSGPSLLGQKRQVAKLLVLLASDHGVWGSNPTEGEILSKPKRHFIAQSPSCSLFHGPDMSEILLKRMETPKSSIHPLWRLSSWRTV